MAPEAGALSGWMTAPSPRPSCTEPRGPQGAGPAQESLFSSWDSPLVPPPQLNTVHSCRRVAFGGNPS